MTPTAYMVSIKNDHRDDNEFRDPRRYPGRKLNTITHQPAFSDIRGKQIGANNCLKERLVKHGRNLKVALKLKGGRDINAATR